MSGIDDKEPKQQLRDRLTAASTSAFLCGDSANMSGLKTPSAAPKRACAVASLPHRLDEQNVFRSIQFGYFSLLEAESSFSK